MPTLLPTSSIKRGLARAVALLGIALVLLLTLLVYSPESHTSIHDHALDGSHECAITLFAQGFAEPLTPTAILVFFGALLLAYLRLAERVELQVPRFLLPLAQAPPAL